MKILHSALLLVVSGFTIYGQCLEASYTFNGNANDQSGNNRNITVNGASLSFDRNGQATEAYYFDGHNDVMLTNHSFDYQNRTVAFWMEPHRLTGLNSVMAQDANYLNYGSFGGNISNGSLTISSGGSDNYSTSNVQVGQWLHIAMTRSATDVKYYIDGQLVYTGSPNTVGSSSYANPNLVLGSDRKGDRKYFKGKLDEILIYSCELSSNQIDSIYQAQKPQVTPNPCLEAHYLFNGSTFDESGKGRTPVNNGASLSTDRFGNNNSAYLFDGNNDVMFTNYSFDYEERTVAFWIEPQRLSGVNAIMSQDANTLNYGTFGSNISNGELTLNASGADKYKTTNLSLGKWMHLAMVRTKDSVRYFVDGQLVSTGVSGFNGSSTYANPNLVLGSDRKGDRKFYHGKLDDIVIYSCALNAQQIDSLYHANNFVSSADAPTRQSFSIYPNPATSEIKINTAHGGQNAYRILNINGAVLQKGVVLDNSIPIEKLAPGIYLISLNGQKGRRQKFIKH